MYCEKNKPECNVLGFITYLGESVPCDHYYTCPVFRSGVPPLNYYDRINHVNGEHQPRAGAVGAEHGAVESGADR